MNSLISDAERRIDGIVHRLELLGKIIVKRAICRRERDKVGVGPNSGLRLGLLNQRRADPATYPAALLMQEPGSMRQAINASTRVWCATATWPNVGLRLTGCRGSLTPLDLRGPLIALPFSDLRAELGQIINSGIELI